MPQPSPVTFFLLSDVLERLFPEKGRLSVRDESVLRLARLCRFEEVHSRHVAKLAHIHGEHPALCTGTYQELFLTNRQYAYARTLDGERIVAVHNIDDGPFSFSINTGGERALDLMTDEELPLEGGRLSLSLDGCTSRILKIVG